MEDQVTSKYNFHYRKCGGQPSMNTFLSKMDMARFHILHEAQTYYYWFNNAVLELRA